MERLNIETACIGAGFVRNLVWDDLHGLESDCRDGDIDVLWFDAERLSSQVDLEIERKLKRLDPSFDWSVKNQARMHIRNNDRPYTDVADAMKFWPETATAIATRKLGSDCELIAPFGFDDLQNMVLRPTSNEKHKREAFHNRIRTKGWTNRWPRISIEL
ncbi:MAG: nucleotidyltransferase family protein [Pseudomonadota bacterium]